MKVLTWSELDDAGRAETLRRGTATAGPEVQSRVSRILQRVRRDGDAALAELGERFDGARARRLQVPPEEISAAAEEPSPALRAAITYATARIRAFHQAGMPRDYAVQTADGVHCRRVMRPIRRVGLYVPAGSAPLPSTALMLGVPAQLAGCAEVVICTPPGAGGRPDPTVLAAAAECGISRVFATGGAQAIAAMAYGTESVPRCDKIVGPGNVYVTEAKRQVAAEGACGIDALAGVTEVAIIADDTADPRLVAVDLVAQAEHDPLAACLLITPSPGLAARVTDALAEEVARTRHADRVRTALRGQGAVALVDDLDHAVTVADAFAAEHLEVQTADAAAVARRVRAAGAIFVGSDTPVSLGDYCAGPNHTLPTGGTARFTGGLRTDDFLVPVNWVQYGPDALADLAPVVQALGEAEDLPAHARAVQARLETGGSAS
ncbi:histidinol dehydrogenase [soil metagenome]